LREGGWRKSKDDRSEDFSTSPGCDTTGNGLNQVPTVFALYVPGRAKHTAREDLTHYSCSHPVMNTFLILRHISLISLSSGYIGEFEEVDDHRNGKIVVQLNGRLVTTSLRVSVKHILIAMNRLNKTGVISPRYNVQLRDMEKWVVKLLPSRQFGYIILTTSAGIMDHEEARRKHVAGKILGFFY
jgi:ribosomal protein S8